MRAFSILLAASALGCATTNSAGDAPKGDEKKPPALGESKTPELPKDPARDPKKGSLLIKGGTVMTAAGQIHSPGYVLVKDGEIVGVGAGEAPKPAVPGDAVVVDATGRFVTPGLIDTHSHMGVYASPSARAHSDGNEATRAATPEVWAEHGFWPQDPDRWRAYTGGITTIQVLPGSANLVGGRSFITKLRPNVSSRLMRFPGARQGLKMACGENPKRVYGQKGGPQTRMGNTAGFRKIFQQATEYKRKWDKYDRDLAFWKANDDGNDPPQMPGRDLGMETLKLVLEDKIWVHNHCYRADDMSKMLDLSEEFGFTIRSFHHALEAYKIKERLADKKVAVSTWADWFGFKMEAFDAVPQNLSIIEQSGGIPVVHSDSATDIRHLNQEAAKARTYGQRLGIEVDDNTLLRWVTYNPAWALGVHDKVGTIERGKHADLVVWSDNPFSIYALADDVFIDGHKVFDRKARQWSPSDFETGFTDPRSLPVREKGAMR